VVNHYIQVDGLRGKAGTAVLSLISLSLQSLSFLFTALPAGPHAFFLPGLRPLRLPTVLRFGLVVLETVLKFGAMDGSVMPGTRGAVAGEAVEVGTGRGSCGWSMGRESLEKV
jgi:hypothetical protein